MAMLCRSSPIFNLVFYHCSLGFLVSLHFASSEHSYELPIQMSPLPKLLVPPSMLARQMQSNYPRPRGHLQKPVLENTEPHQRLSMTSLTGLSLLALIRSFLAPRLLLLMPISLLTLLLPMPMPTMLLMLLLPMSLVVSLPLLMTLLLSVLLLSSY